MKLPYFPAMLPDKNCCAFVKKQKLCLCGTLDVDCSGIGAQVSSYCPLFLQLPTGIAQWTTAQQYTQFFYSCPVTLPSNIVHSTSAHLYCPSFLLLANSFYPKLCQWPSSTLYCTVAMQCDASAGIVLHIAIRKARGGKSRVALKFEALWEIPPRTILSTQSSPIHWRPFVTGNFLWKNAKKLKKIVSNFPMTYINHLIFPTLEVSLPYCSSSS